MFENNNVYATADYVGFIKKIMKLMQKGYNEIQALEVELRILEQTSAPPSRPRKCIQCIFFLHFFVCISSIDSIYISVRFLILLLDLDSIQMLKTQNRNNKQINIRINHVAINAHTRER